MNISIVCILECFISYDRLNCMIVWTYECIYKCCFNFRYFEL